jgi:ubiquinone/menaquinone biosynthesis C-methylase UbiE
MNAAARITKGFSWLAKHLPGYVKGTFGYQHFHGWSGSGQAEARSYWGSRTSGTGQSRVLWQNEQYNALIRGPQREVLRRFIAGLPENSAILDIGCGIGVLAKIITEIHRTALIHAVDFAEMVGVAQQENPSPRIRYISGAAEDYLPPNQHYNAILSAGCYSAFRDISKLEQGLDNAVTLLASKGVLILIDPFHRWNYLARAKYSSGQVTRYLTRRGLRRIHKGGMLFWPYRERLADSVLSGERLNEAFAEGERLLARLGQHLWADYKVLVFEKP